MTTCVPLLYRWLFSFAIFLLAITAIPAAYAQAPEVVAQIRIEHNATDMDNGIQAFFDAEGWEKVSITAPDGKIFSVRARGNLGALGLTEVFFESEEPSITELPLADFLALFPAGEYTFKIKTVEGDKLSAVAVLSHTIPDGAVIISPTPGQVVDPSDVVVEWQDVTTPAGVDIVKYQVIVEQDEPLRTFSIDLLPSANNVRVPSKFFQDGMTYKAEVVAVDAGGNQTVTEVEFSTTPAP